MIKRSVLLISLSSLSIILSILLVEIVFRIWRPPQVRMQREKILLRQNITTENNYNSNSDKIRNHITIRRNSLGFRGPEPPLDFAQHLTVVAIGGSTTETIFITEGKGWTDYLQTHLLAKYPTIWINNAGIDGHSTFGHIQFMKQYIGQLKPNYALFLVGINDMALDQGRIQDAMQITETTSTTPHNLVESIVQHSMILSFIQYLKAKKGSHEFTAMMDQIYDYRILGAATDYNPITAEDKLKYVYRITQYKIRLRELMTITRRNSIRPILITQPAVYGFGTDPETGVNLGDIIISDFTEEDINRKGSDKWIILQLYNNATKEIAQEMNIPVIDLANEMPKNTTYYYDYVHFTESGAQKVGEILTRHLTEIL